MKSLERLQGVSIFEGFRVPVALVESHTHFYLRNNDVRGNEKSEHTGDNVANTTE